MKLNEIVDLVVLIIGITCVVIPYIATILIHTKNRYLKMIGQEAIKITSALEETTLSGTEKKKLAIEKLNTLFGGNTIKYIAGLNLTPEQLADQVDAAVSNLRTLGVKPVLEPTEKVDIIPIGFNKEP